MAFHFLHVDTYLSLLSGDKVCEKQKKWFPDTDHKLTCIICVHLFLLCGSRNPFSTILLLLLLDTALLCFIIQ